MRTGSAKELVLAKRRDRSGGGGESEFAGAGADCGNAGYIKVGRGLPDESRRKNLMLGGRDKANGKRLFAKG